MYSKRPTTSETQDDLEKLQTEFIAEKSKKDFKAAATFVSEIKQQNNETKGNLDEVMEIEEKLAHTFESIPDHSHLGTIQEKLAPTQPLPKLIFNKKGFPNVHKRDFNLKPSNGGGSLFARGFKKIKTNPGPSPAPKIPQTLPPTSSCILTGQEKDTIHLENTQKINTMSSDEILEEKERLLSTLDPAIINYLRARRSELENTPISSTIASQITVENIETIESCNEILVQSEKWLNFDKIELNKLAWMDNIENVKKIDKNQAYEARFDFDGWLLPHSAEITEENRTLYHHGAESSRPGYTLQELIQMARSSVNQQKITALNAIANLLALHSIGIYTEIVDLPLEQIFFVLRFCLDENTPNVLNASVKAMRNLFHSRIDEACLDSLIGYGNGLVQPVVSLDEELEDDSAVNDQQLAEKNLVKCLVRTGIIARIRYIINTMRPKPETSIYCLDILIRMGRDSHFILDQIYRCAGLLESIVGRFVAKNFEGEPLIEAVKFLRVLASRSEKIAHELVEKHGVMEPLLAYLSSGDYSMNATGMRLQTEALLLWAVFASFGLAINCFERFKPVLANCLVYHFENTDLDLKTTFIRQRLVLSWFVLLSEIAKSVSLAQFEPLFFNCARKWTKQFMALEEFSCGKLQIISALLLLQNAEIEPFLLQLIVSKSFDLVTNSIKNGSMLLNNYETLKSSPNLKNLEAAAWFAPDHIIPILQTNSSIPFLASLASFIEKSRNFELKLTFLAHKNIRKYLDLLATNKHFFMTNSWFVRVEAGLIMSILMISIEIRTKLDDSRRFYEVAVKSLSIFGADQKPEILFLLSNIVFNPGFYPSESLLRNLSLDQRSDQLDASLANLDEILAVYTRVLGLKKDVPDFSKSLSLHLNQANTIPIDWIYTPIIALYSSQHEKDTKMPETDQIFIIKNCLRWILIYESYFPNLARAIHPTDRFCRVACVFLASDSLFLVPEIHKLLELALKNVLIHFEDKISFEREIQGLSNFEDFYIQLLEQYQGVSYGDQLFGNFILVALAQRHSMKWRKTLWSEYSCIVEVFNVTKEECFCKMESFLDPLEEDLSLLKCYRRALVSNALRKNSMLFVIAKHHVEGYVARKKAKTE